MASGIFTIYEMEYEARIVWESVSNGALANTSKVTATLQIRLLDGAQMIVSQWEGRLTVGSKAVYGYIGEITTDTWVDLVTVSDTISHNSSGVGSCFLRGFVYPQGGIIADKNTTVMLDAIPQITALTSAPNFNDEQAVTITYSNSTPSLIDSAHVCISLDKSVADIPYKKLDMTTNSYTFNFTAAEQETLWSLVTSGNSVEVYFIIQTLIGGSPFYSEMKRTLTLINATPTFSPIIEDGNTDTGALTGDINTLIKYHNTAVYSIGASGRKGATIVSQYIKNGDVVNTSPYGEFTNVESNIFEISATDNRGVTLTQTVETKWTEYFKPTIVATATAPTSVKDMQVTIDGNCFYGAFSEAAAAQNNSFTLSYRYAAVNYDLGEWIEVDYTPTFDMYSHTITLTDVDYRLGYNFQAKIADSLNTVESTVIRINTIPVFDWSADDFNFNVPVNMQVGHINYNLYGLAKAMTQASNFTCITTSGDNYLTTSFSASLVGNCLRCNLSATRNAATGGALVTNEKVCDVTISHNEKISGMLNVSFGNGSTGGVASFYTTEISQTAETLSFAVYLASTAQSDTSFNTFFIVPVTINLDKFVD